MSSNFACESIFSATPAEVYDAITTQAGLENWWTTTCEAGERIGDKSTFHFGETYNVMEISKLEPNLEVRWKCIEQHHHAPDEIEQVDEWKGTTVIFQIISQTETSTQLKFEHVGLVPEMECYAICDQGWTHFITVSLKSYVETGKGAPFAG